MAISVFDNPYYKSPDTSPLKQMNVKGPQFQQMPTQGGTPMMGGAKGGGWMSAVQSGLQGAAAGAGAASEEGRFSIDPNAGFKGSFGGLQSGGVVGAIAGGVMAQMGTFSRVNKNLKELKTGFEGFTSDGYNAPQFQAGGFSQARQTLAELKEGQRKIKRSIDPATRAFSAVYGTNKKLREKERAQKSAILGQQQEFNEANLAYQRQQLARRNYESQLADVYGLGKGYF